MVETYQYAHDYMDNFIHQEYLPKELWELILQTGRNTRKNPSGNSLKIVEGQI